MSGLLQDLRYALRKLRGNLAFTITAVATLALGIGLNTTIFSVFDALALRPLPLRDASSLVNVYQSVRNDPGGYRPFSYPEYLAFQDSKDALSGLVAFSWVPAELDLVRQDRRDSETAHGLLVSENYFSVLGGETSVGRSFLGEENQAFHALPVIVLSHSFWRQRFRSDGAVVGRMIALNGVPFTIIGVAAPDFVGTEPQVPDFWAPLGVQTLLTPSNPLLSDRDSFWLQVVGRLKPGVSLPQAQANMTGLLERLAPEYLGNSPQSSVLLTPGTLLSRPDERGRIASNALLVTAAVSIVLLIACANVAGLVLVRAATRRTDTSVRLSLGASRWRLVQQLLAENMVIALLGGGVGLLLAWKFPNFLVRSLQPPYEQPFFLPTGLDLRVLTYTLVLSLTAGVGVALVPALQFSKSDLLSWLTDGTRRFGLRLDRSRVHQILVVAETSVCLVLLTASGLLVRALQKAQRIDLGFNSSNVLTISLHLGAHGYDNARAAEFHHRFAERVQSLPGVKSVSLVSLPPLGGVSRAGRLTVSGRTLPANVSSDYWTVSPNYFETLQIPVFKGRAFTSEDTLPGSIAAIVNEAMAHDLWPGEDPVGKRFRLGPPSVPFTEVVGVVKNTRGARLWETNKPYVYLPLLQTTKGPPIQTAQLGMQFLVRTEGKPKAIAAMVPNVAEALDSNVKVSASPLENSVGRWLWFSRVGALLSTVLGLSALILAAMGIYGVMSYSMAQRTREIGIRIALGADRITVRKLAFTEGLRLSLLAVGIGLVISFPAMRIMAGLLYGLGTADPVTFISVSLLLTSVTLLACYIPARRAAKVDPMVALRYE